MEADTTSGVFIGTVRCGEAGFEDKERCVGIVHFFELLLGYDSFGERFLADLFDLEATSVITETGSPQSGYRLSHHGSGCGR